MARARLVLDALDSRVLPAATLANGVLTIDGTDGRDVIVVRQMGDHLSVRGELIDVDGAPARTVPVAAITRIEISAGAGDDVVILAGVHVPSAVDASTGDDRVIGGGGDDTVGGGAGDDRIWGRRGNDHLSGGADDDLICGGRGNDHLLGEDGDDRVSGRDGDDDCDGGAGDDRVSGGRGRDHNRGGDGDDRVTDVDDHGTSVEGVITAINLSTSTVTIRTESGTLVDVTAGPNTEIERNDVHTTLAAFQVGDRAEVKFDAQGAPLEIEAESV